MSHAVVLVALDGVKVMNARKIEQAVTAQMSPFGEDEDEGRGRWRWDWWKIGGRWDGMLAGHNIVRRRDLDTLDFMSWSRKEMRDLWRHLQRDRKRYRKNIVGALYGEPATDLDMPEAAFVEKHARGTMPVPFAFLRNRKWYQEARHRSAQWEARFYKRFIQPLSLDTVLVVVDFHYL